MAKPRKLTPQQELFCWYYVDMDGKDGTDAAIAAGYSPNRNSTKVTVSKQLLKNPLILERIKELTDKKQAKREVIADAVAFDALSELADQARAWRGSDDGVQMCHVRAAELYMHNSGQSPEAKKIMAEIYGKMNASEFFGWTKDELEHYASTGQRPARFTQPSGTASIN